MTDSFTEADLEAYLDEALAPEKMTEIEAALRTSNDLVEQLKAINARRDEGIHALGEIWRHLRLSVLSDEEASYVCFHVETIGCRYCQANLQDLKLQQSEAADSSDTRRRRYFETSAGYLKDS
jgi:hypothetical protein